MQTFYCEFTTSSSNFHLLHMHTQSVNLADQKKKIAIPSSLCAGCLPDSSCSLTCGFWSFFSSDSSAGSIDADDSPGSHHVTRVAGCVRSGGKSRNPGHAFSII